ncbi:helix-turn-helix domain-containing protein [Sulfitobacter sp. CW3]|uniref:winged helix-turn-helix transcriptional regulator n=1 Tax=Sulfitobacter sp. CW3 TaxID=2861965 RepID=UPI0019DCDAA0|nr:helix-turn-helix domain-containing protein [Sulfitobacter sp. CW3]MBW4962263.1 helix-turn-helix transcriptional regulator [Sulfitobacter sp. CW3]NOR31235.1 transcriptional regulator [Sulfitobacter sp.]
MKWNDLQSEACPVARGLSVVGDRWTMLVLRDCFLGVRRFEQMQERLGITRHVLADRLRKLEAAGVLRREPYQQRPLRQEYRLTERGKALYPMLVSLIEWANAHVPPPGEPSVTLVSRETGDPIVPVLVDANTGEKITHMTVNALRAE